MKKLCLKIKDKREDTCKELRNVAHVIANWKRNAIKLLEINRTNEIKNSAEQKDIFKVKEKPLMDGCNRRRDKAGEETNKLGDSKKNCPEYRTERPTENSEGEGRRPGEQRGKACVCLASWKEMRRRMSKGET